MFENVKATEVREAELKAQQVANDLYEPTEKQIAECRLYILHLAKNHSTPPAWLLKIWNHVWTAITDQKQQAFGANPSPYTRRLLRVFEALAVNTMLPKDPLAKVLENYPEMGLQNPSVVILLMEDPGWLMPYITGNSSTNSRWTSFAKKRLLQSQPRMLVRALLGTPYVDLLLPEELRYNPEEQPRVRIWKSLELWEIAYVSEENPNTFVGIWEADLLTAFEKLMIANKWTDRQKLDFFKGPITWMRQRQPDYVPPEPTPVDSPT